MAAVLALPTSIDGTSYPEVMEKSGVEKNPSAVRVGVDVKAVADSESLGCDLAERSRRCAAIRSGEAR